MNLERKKTMRITKRQKELISKKIADKVVKTFKIKSVGKNPLFIKYKKAKKESDMQMAKYRKARDVQDDLFRNLGEQIFGSKNDYVGIDTDTGATDINFYSLRRAIEDELHLTELSSHEDVDSIINEVAKQFEVN
jgi:hypothetical protein